MKRILIVSELHLIRTFLLPSLAALKAEADVQFDCLIVTKISQSEAKQLRMIFQNVYSNNYPSEIISCIPKLRTVQYLWGLRRAAKTLPFYDIAHIFFHHPYFALISRILKGKARKFYVSFLGSDFNEARWFGHLCNRITISVVDRVLVAQNPQFLKSMVDHYRLDQSGKETGILPLLMNSFISFEDYLDRTSRDKAKESMGLGGKRVIVCGYNAEIIVRHLDIVNALLSVKDKLENYTILFPMTYGRMPDADRQRVKTLMSASGISYKVLEDYLQFEKLWALRLAPDIFIHVQECDQLAASLLEHLAAGTVVITGSWLPYAQLEERGMYLVRIAKVEDLAAALVEVMGDLDNRLKLCKRNRELVFDLMNWERNKRAWYDAYSLHEQR